MRSACLALVLACSVRAGLASIAVIPTTLLLFNQQTSRVRSIQGAVSLMRLRLSDEDDGGFSFISPLSPAGDGNSVEPDSPGFIKVSSFDPDRIEEGTWNGYLKEQFENMTDGDARGLISFEQFVTWKQKNGLVYEREEVHDLWENVLEDRLASCNLEMFIKLNFIIDEQ